MITSRAKFLFLSLCLVPTFAAADEVNVFDATQEDSMEFRALMKNRNTGSLSAPSLKPAVGANLQRQQELRGMIQSTRPGAVRAAGSASDRDKPGLKDRDASGARTQNGATLGRPGTQPVPKAAENPITHTGD